MLGQSLSLLHSRVLFSLLRSFLESFTQSHLTRSFECHSESSPQMDTGYGAGDKNDIHLNRSNNCLVLSLDIIAQDHKNQHLHLRRSCGPSNHLSQDWFIGPVDLQQQGEQKKNKGGNIVNISLRFKGNTSNFFASLTQEVEGQLSFPLLLETWPHKQRSQSPTTST